MPPSQYIRVSDRVIGPDPGAAFDTTVNVPIQGKAPQLWIVAGSARNQGATNTFGALVTCEGAPEGAVAVLDSGVGNHHSFPPLSFSTAIAAAGSPDVRVASDPAFPGSWWDLNDYVQVAVIEEGGDASVRCSSATVPGPAESGPLNCSMKFAIPNVDGSTGVEQLIMVTGSACYADAAGLMQAEVTVTGGALTAPESLGNIQVWVNQQNTSLPFIALLARTTLQPIVGNGKYTLAINATDGKTTWGPGDECQLIIFEMDHSNIGGGS